MFEREHEYLMAIEVELEAWSVEAHRFERGESVEDAALRHLRSAMEDAVAETGQRWKRAVEADVCGPWPQVHCRFEGGAERARATLERCVHKVARVDGVNRILLATLYGSDGINLRYTGGDDKRTGPADRPS